MLTTQEKCKTSQTPDADHKLIMLLILSFHKTKLVYVNHDTMTP